MSLYLIILISSTGAQYIDRDLPVDCKGSVGRSHGINKVDVSPSSILTMKYEMWSGIFGLFIKTTTLTSLRRANWRRRVKELKSQLSFFSQLTSKAKAATEASFRVSHLIVKNKKSFQDGEMVKEAFVEAADSLFRDFKNKPEILPSIKALQPSRSTVTRRSEAMAKDLTQQLWKDITDCKCFSLQLDESTDMSDTAQLCIFIRMVFTNMIAKEELLTVLPMKEHTRGEDIFQSFKNFEKTQLPVCKLVSITTDGAPAMVGRSNGFIAKCREDDAFPDFLNYHCIIHQQALCTKMLSM